ncbi:MAG: hypothetical protein PUP46_02060 [Endozoicomonas sp. (ex Botrylloides leachii)]|nr:hypothetical protein [Endozoicomonas sp. (ex Botrylloides leachii)]
MKELKDLLDSNPEAVHHIIKALKQKGCLEIQPMATKDLGSKNKKNVQIERFCHMISLGVSSPFPRSQQQLAYAVIGIKKALKAISLVELLYRKPEIKPLIAEGIRPEIKPIKALKELLQLPLFQSSLPNLAQAARFMHEKDQVDILKILCLKLQQV